MGFPSKHQLVHARMGRQIARLKPSLGGEAAIPLQVVMRSKSREHELKGKEDRSMELFKPERMGLFYRDKTI